MKIDSFPDDIKDYIIPSESGQLIYICLDCEEQFDIDKLLYTCPKCGNVLLLFDDMKDRLKEIDGKTWRRIFDYRKMLNIPALKGIYRYHEFLGPVMPLDSVVYLGEGHTPVVEANEKLSNIAGCRFYYKNDGQNPSASFKDRGMASALSYINYLVKKGVKKDILAVCASTGDTSAAAALYSSYISDSVKSAVLLPHKKVTPQQLSQPLGSGAKVFEIPGVFDDCMKVVENLSENYDVALLNSKNAWRILGQESYSYEIAQDFDYDLKNIVVVVPVGNAGNVTAIMSGFLKFFEAGIIDELPKVVGVQSKHANPVTKYYSEKDPSKRKFEPVKVKASVAQAAMIGNPVSMPRVIYLTEKYNQASNKENVFFVEVTEQEIMDCNLLANRNGHIACTQGGESLAGLLKARKSGVIGADETAVLDSTAHAIKFSGFQDQYFGEGFDDEFSVTPNEELINRPIQIEPSVKSPKKGEDMTDAEFRIFVEAVTKELAGKLNL
jgi:threonine synthase